MPLPTVGRILIVAFMAGGVASSSFVRAVFDSVYQASQTFMSMFQGSLLALLLLGMLSRRVTPWRGVAGMGLGIAIWVLLHFAQALLYIEREIPLLWVAW